MPYADLAKRRKASADAGRRWRERDPEMAKFRNSLVQIRQRCNNPRHPRYADYGGRGITVCKRWDSFEAFLEDMGKRPSPLHTIERINNDGNYEPGNCRWATRQEQSTNKRNCIYVELAGERLTLAEACRNLRLPYKIIHSRINRLGWEIYRALAVPIVPGGWNESRREACKS